MAKFSNAVRKTETTPTTFKTRTIATCGPNRWDAVHDLAREFSAWLLELERDCRDDLNRAERELASMCDLAADEWDAGRTTANSEVLRDYLGAAIRKAEIERDLKAITPLLANIKEGWMDFDTRTAFEYWAKFLIATFRRQEWEATGLSFCDLVDIGFKTDCAVGSKTTADSEAALKKLARRLEDQTTGREKPKKAALKVL